MKKLIVVRHGDYGNEGSLNEKGKQQIFCLIESLRDLMGNCRILVLSSPLPRAKESAELVAGAFEAAFETTEVLMPGFFKFEEGYDPVLSLIQARREQVEVLILVTHLDYTEGILTHFSREEWGQDLLPEGQSLSKGGAWVVDCEKRSLLV